jgi:hypothetical protein
MENTKPIQMERVALWLHRLKLGENYWLAWRGSEAKLCQLIKASPKGFNFLDIERDVCVFKRHMFDGRFSNRRLPSVSKLKEIPLHLWISNNWYIRPANSVVRYVDRKVDTTA